MPSGIAHFLEHKLFEQEKGAAVHEFYKKSGNFGLTYRKKCVIIGFVKYK